MRWYAPILYLWTSPNTLLGLLPLPMLMLQGGSVRCVDGVIEMHGGIVSRLLRRGIPWLKNGVAAMTIGHVVWGTDQTWLDITRSHERVHVRQYERWGPLFLPAYGVASLLAWWRGEDAYRDNHFEREAYDREESEFQ